MDVELFGSFHDGRQVGVIETEGIVRLRAHEPLRLFPVARTPL